MTPRPSRTAARAAAVVLAAAVAATGCGVRPTTPVDAGPAPIATANINRYALYFVTKKGGLIRPQMRDGNPSVPDGLLSDLNDGPDGAGLTTRLHGFRYNEGTPLNASGSQYNITYLTTGRARKLPKAALAQIVCTVTARPPIQQVNIVLYHTQDVIGRWFNLTCRQFTKMLEP